MIGVPDKIKGISGGEKKRLAFASEVGFADTVLHVGLLWSIGSPHGIAMPKGLYFTAVDSSFFFLFFFDA